jgi:hypothetical protein
VRKRNNSRRVKDKYEPNLELYVDNVTEVTVKIEDQCYLDKLLRELEKMDDELIADPNCAIIDDYPFHLIDIAPEEPEINIETSKKKGKGGKNRGRFFNNAATPEKQFAKDRKRSKIFSRRRESSSPIDTKAEDN